MAGAKAPFIRFHEKIEQSATGCWEWTGQRGSSGYGQIKAFGKMVSAHRFAYALYKGPIDDGQEVLHACDNRLCVNPAHLSVGTHQQNMIEARQRRRMRSGDDHPMFGRKNPRPEQAHRVRVLGVEYESQKSAERHLGLGSGTVRYWIRNKPEKAQIIAKGI